MRKRLLAFLVVSHLAIGFFGFALGIYTLPILSAPPAPTAQQVTNAVGDVQYSAQFTRDLADSDSLHWGEGEVTIGNNAITLMGKLAPGPSYKLYLAKEFVETEAKFKQLKSQMALVGDVKTFDNFVVNLPSDVDPSQYNTVIVWCESFNEFITAAKYR